MLETWVQSLGLEDLLGEDMAIDSSILAWRMPMDRGAWWAIVHGVLKSWTWLSDQAQHSTQQYWLPLIKAGCLQSVPTLPAAEANTEFQNMVPLPGGDHPATFWQADYTGLVISWHHGRSNILSLLEESLTLDADLSFLHTVLLCLSQSIVGPFFSSNLLISQAL